MRHKGMLSTLLIMIIVAIVTLITFAMLLSLSLFQLTHTRLFITAFLFFTFSVLNIANSRVVNNNVSPFSPPIFPHLFLEIEFFQVFFFFPSLSRID